MRKQVVTVALLCGLIAAPVLANDAEVPVLPSEQPVAPAPVAPPSPFVMPRTDTCPAKVRLKRVPVYEEVEVPVYERRTVPRYREVEVPVFTNRRVPVWTTRRVPVYAETCVLTFDPPLVPRFERQRCPTGWREERVLRGERFERVRCGVRPHLVADGVEVREVQTGTRTVRRLVGWRAEPSREGPASGPRVCEGVLKPCAR